MKNFSKLIQAFLLLSSIMMIGCGGNNPTGSTATTPEDKAPSNVVSEKGQFRVWGNITSNDAEIADEITVRLTNRGSNMVVGERKDNSIYIFDGVEPGIYEIEAKGTGYDTYKTCLEILATQTINIDLEKTALNTTPIVPKLYFQGKLQDISGSYIPFATVIIEKNGNKRIAGTEFDSGKYTLLALSSGTYQISFIKDSFQPINNMKLEIKDEYISFNGKRIEKADFGHTTTFTDTAGITRNGYLLDTVYMSPELNQTGSLAGALSGYISGECSLYKTQGEFASTPPDKVLNFTPRSDGYFFIKNLQPGWYCVVKASSPDPVLITDGSGNSLGYKFNSSDKYTSWLQVENNKTTPVPHATNYD